MLQAQGHHVGEGAHLHILNVSEDGTVLEYRDEFMEAALRMATADPDFANITLRLAPIRL